jgi:hypothetical protein
MQTLPVKGKYKRPIPSLEIIRAAFREENGRLFWVDRRPLEHFQCERAHRSWHVHAAGKEAGYYQKMKFGGPRWVIPINGVRLRRYQVIWLLHNGTWAERLDHINRNTLDDRIENLRECTHSQNLANTGPKKNNKSGYKGVYWAQGLWTAVICVNRKHIYLGGYDDPKKAHEAYVAASKQYHGEFACVGT